MSDYLVQLGRSGMARRMVSALGLPLPLPQDLKRESGEWRERELEGMTLGVGGHSQDVGDLAAKAGAVLRVGKAAQEKSEGLQGLLFDARGIRDVGGLRGVYEFFHGNLRSLRRCGRVVVVGAWPEDREDAMEAAVAAGLEGFIRSVSKEVGRKGATANLIMVEQGAEAHLDGVLRFLLSQRSAFITGQPFHVRGLLDAADTTGYVHSLAGKVALVTGAARGIGEATVRRLAAEGATVICLDRPGDDGPLTTVAAEIGGHALSLDVTDAKTPSAIVEYLQKQFGGVDIVLHNAGLTRDRTLGKMSKDEWDLALNVNLDAVIRIHRALEQADCIRAGGRVVCLSSIAGIAGNVGQTNYAASKAGLIGFVRHQSPVLAAKDIAIFAVAPGFIETRLTDAIPFMTREGARRLASLGQGGLPADVAELLTFLSMPMSSGLTGDVIRICGGSLVGA